MARDPIYEDVPLYNMRSGDVVFAGRNNSAVVCGRDRLGGVDTGYGDSPGSAAVHVIVGRRAQDPSPIDDAATFYLSQRTDPDRQAGTVGLGTEQSDKSGAVLRADCVRIVPRVDLKISTGKAYVTVSSDGKIVLDGEISLGEGASDRVIKGDEFAKFWSTLSIPTPVGPSGPPPPLPPQVFSSRTVKVK